MSPAALDKLLLDGYGTTTIRSGSGRVQEDASGQRMDAAMNIGVGMAVEPIHRIYDNLRLLARSSRIEVNQRYTWSHLSAKNGEICPNPGHIKNLNRFFYHDLNLICVSIWTVVAVYGASAMGGSFLRFSDTTKHDLAPSIHR